jgi:tight adherence protein B
VATWLFISSATYMRPLYTTTLGEVMLFGATGLIVVGALWMHRLIKVEV